MKNKLVAVAGILLIGSLIFTYARSDYSWSDIIIEKKIEEGWTLAFTQDNFVDIIRPWTWFKTPVTGLWFTKPGQLLQRGSVVVAPILRVSYDYSRTEQQEYIEFFDVNKGKSALPPENTPFEAVIFHQLEWHDYPSGTPGDKMIKYEPLAKFIKMGIFFKKE